MLYICAFKGLFKFMQQINKCMFIIDYLLPTCIGCYCDHQQATFTRFTRILIKYNKLQLNFISILVNVPW